MKETDYKKHPFENNKLINVMNDFENRWKQSKRFYRYYHNGPKPTDAKQRENAVTEKLYHIALQKIKQLFSCLPKYDRIAVEIDMRLYPQSTCELHTLSFSTFMFDLNCDPLGTFYISIRFNNCPLEEEVEKILVKYSLINDCRIDTKIKDYDAYFKQVLRVQPERFITLLSIV